MTLCGFCNKKIVFLQKKQIHSKIFIKKIYLSGVYWGENTALYMIQGVGFCNRAVE